MSQIRGIEECTLSYNDLNAIFQQCESNIRDFSNAPIKGCYLTVIHEVLPRKLFDVASGCVLGTVL